MNVAMHVSQIGPDIAQAIADFARSLHVALFDSKGREDRYNKRVGRRRFKRLERRGWFKHLKPGDVVVMDLKGHSVAMASSRDKAIAFYVSGKGDLKKPHYIHVL